MSIFHVWNSIDSVRRVHSVLEFVALIFFGILVVCDVLAHKSKDRKRERIFEAFGLWFFAIAVICELVAYPYGQRNDELSSNVISSLDQKSREALTASDTAITQSGQAKDTSNEAAEIAGKAFDKANSIFGIATKAKESAMGSLALAGEAKAQVAKVDAKIQATEANVERVDEKFSFRTLDSLKRIRFIYALKNARHKPRDPVQMEAFMGVADGTTYGAKIAEAINDPSTGWKAGQTAAAALSGSCKGVVLSVPVDGYLPPWAVDLQQALLMSGIGGAISLSRDQPENTVIVLVCPKS